MLYIYIYIYNTKLKQNTKSLDINILYIKNIFIGYCVFILWVFIDILIEWSRIQIKRILKKAKHTENERKTNLPVNNWNA